MYEGTSNITDWFDGAGVCVDHRTFEVEEVDLPKAADGKDGRCKFDRPARIETRMDAENCQDSHSAK